MENFIIVDEWLMMMMSGRKSKAVGNLCVLEWARSYSYPLSDTTFFVLLIVVC